MNKDGNPEDIVLEGEVIRSEDISNLSQKEKMAKIAGLRAKPLKVRRKQQQVNVTKIMYSEGFCPVRTLVLIAQNRYKELGLEKPITAHEVNSATQTLFHVTVPGIKPVDFINPDEEIKQIPVFIPKRGFAQIEDLDPPAFLEQNDED